MGYKILDVKADIHEDVEAYFERLLINVWDVGDGEIRNECASSKDILDIVDKHFEKIEHN